MKLIRSEDRETKRKRSTQKKRCEQRWRHRQQEKSNRHAWCGHDAVRSVCFDEVVTRNRLRIQMMFAEGSDEIGTENRSRLGSISVCEPMHNPGNQIGLYVPGHHGRC